jgi:hypothetical protein
MTRRHYYLEWFEVDAKEGHELTEVFEESKYA